MAATIELTRSAEDRNSALADRIAPELSHAPMELSRPLLWLILMRAGILFLGMNLAEPLRILPDHLSRFAFLPLTNILIVAITSTYLLLWWSGRQLLLQLYLQVGVDLVLLTALVAFTGGVESPFLSFYLLVIIYCSLTLGRDGGIASAALCVLLYAGIITAGQSGIFLPGGRRLEYSHLTFRVFFHALGFFAVAFLGNDLSRRLHAMETELKTKTDSLRKLQSLNENIVGSIRSGLMTADLSGRIALFNRTAEDLLGINRDSVLGKPLASILEGELWCKTAAADLLGSAQALRHEGWFTIETGTRKYLGFSVSPLEDQEHRQIGYIIAFQDLTEIKRLEEEVRLKDRMAAIGKMAAGIAHEIRNPLTAMRGSVEVLRSRGNLPGGDKRLLDILIHESDRLNKFVEDFLHLARPEKSGQQPIDLVPLLEDSVTLLRNSPEVEENCELIFRCHALEIPILGNANQLRQVFWNLCQNAFKAMSSGGILTITARIAYDGGAKVVFQDTGIGMSSEEKERLFQPFQSGFAKGFGLGLSITFQIMEEHQGKISIESEKGRGTAVALYFPPRLIQNQSGNS